MIRQGADMQPLAEDLPGLGSGVHGDLDAVGSEVFRGRLHKPAEGRPHVQEIPPGPVAPDDLQPLLPYVEGIAFRLTLIEVGIFGVPAVIALLIETLDHLLPETGIHEEETAGLASIYTEGGIVSGYPIAGSHTAGPAERAAVQGLVEECRVADMRQEGG